MSRRRITLEDGRYLIFYTFGEGAGAPVEGRAGGGERAAGAGPEAPAGEAGREEEGGRV